MTIRFETDRLIVRNAQAKDMDVMLRIYTRKKNMEYISGGKYDWTADELRNKYSRINQGYSEGYGIFIVELKETSQVVGEAGLFLYPQESGAFELGYILDYTRWGCGYGSEICEGLIRYAFSVLDAQTVVARMYALNKASVRLCEKYAMQKTASDIAENGKEFYEYRILK